MLVSPLQPSKADSPILVTLSGIIMLVSPVQPEKAEFSILVTLSGIVIFFISVLPLKAFFSIVLQPSAIFTVSNWGNCDKLFFVKYLMGAEIYVTYSHPLKA